MHGYVSKDGYMQLEFLSKKDQGMQGAKAVRRGTRAEVLLVDEYYDIFARRKGRLLVVAS